MERETRMGGSGGSRLPYECKKDDNTCISSSHAKHEREVMRHPHILVEREPDRCFPPSPLRSRGRSFAKQGASPICHPACTFSHYPYPNAHVTSQHHPPCYAHLVIQCLVELSTCSGVAGEKKPPARLHRWWHRLHNSTRGEVVAAARVCVWHL